MNFQNLDSISGKDWLINGYKITNKRIGFKLILYFSRLFRNLRSKWEFGVFSFLKTLDSDRIPNFEWVLWIDNK
jgi:hypothetical protein